jgi:hypothetical protein
MFADVSPTAWHETWKLAALSLKCHLVLKEKITYSHLFLWFIQLTKLGMEVERVYLFETIKYCVQTYLIGILCISGIIRRTVFFSLKAEMATEFNASCLVSERSLVQPRSWMFRVDESACSLPVVE